MRETSQELPSFESWPSLGEGLKVLFPEGMDKESFLVFLRYLGGVSASDQFLRLYAIFGKELFLFCSMFQGQVVRVPPVHSLRLIRDYSRIYSFLKARSFSEEGFKKCGEMFGKRRPQLNQIVRRVERALSGRKLSAPKEKRSAAA
jgi:hypothetical protein